ncbi:putative calmodulin-3 [Teleopsis dalmanni]|uniref:putative calmodulin-3 n=1 Tax=Teleopsis dalmanni TaxID=139649 RepID=UPI0018CCE79A|nr:putative calmodulin-3 [Teleopsis dalmanni]
MEKPSPTLIQKIAKEIINTAKSNMATLTSHELGTIIHSLGVKTSEDELQALIEDMHANSSSLSNLHKNILKIPRRICDDEYKKEIREAFRLLNKSDETYVLKSDLISIIKSTGITLTDEEFHEIIKDAGLGDGDKITYEEFISKMQFPRKPR